LGLKLRYNLFYEVSAPAVWGALQSFYRGRELSPSSDPDNYQLHEQDGRWCILSWDAGWEWVTRRNAQLHVSERLHCPGLLAFVYDGEYWGYELFENGKVVNRFVQYPPGDGTQNWFPGDSCVGDPELFAACFPEISAETVAPYLAQTTFASRKLPPRPGDQFAPFDECSVVDFLRTIGVRVALREGYVTLDARIYKQFAIR
jgi:hypothetical protein